MLIIDSHVTHTKNLAATDMAQDAGVATHDSPIPALDGAFFGPFGNDALRMWMREHVGRQVTTWQVAKILNSAVAFACLPYRQTGLWLRVWSHLFRWPTTHLFLRPTSHQFLGPTSHLTIPDTRYYFMHIYHNKTSQNNVENATKHPWMDIMTK